MLPICSLGSKALWLMPNNMLKSRKLFSRPRLNSLPCGSRGWCFPKMEVDCWRFMVARARSVRTTVRQIHKTRAIRKAPRGAARLLRFCTVSGSWNSLNSFRSGFPVHLSSPVDPAHTPKRPAGQLCFLCPASSDQGHSRMRRVGPALNPYPASVVLARDLAQSVQGPRSWFPA